MSVTGLGVRAVIFTVLLVSAAAPASAQDAPNGEFSAGWKMLHAMDVFAGVDQTVPKGWYADLSANLSNSFAIVGEISGAYKTYEQSVTQLGIRIDASANVSIHTFMGGLRVSKRTPKVVPFAQVLFGAAVVGASVEGSATVGGTTINIDEAGGSTSDFAFDAGGGVNLNLSNNVGLRFQGSYVRIGGDGGGNGLRLGAGLVVPF